MLVLFLRQVSPLPPPARLLGKRCPRPRCCSPAALALPTSGPAWAAPAMGISPGRAHLPLLSSWRGYSYPGSRGRRGARGELRTEAGILVYSEPGRAGHLLVIYAALAAAPHARPSPQVRDADAGERTTRTRQGASSEFQEDRDRGRLWQRESVLPAGRGAAPPVLPISLLPFVAVPLDFIFILF